MVRWYALSTVSGREQEATALLEWKVGRDFLFECRVLKKEKVFRSGGILHRVEDVMFPGYVLVNTNCPEKLAKELRKSWKFPQSLMNKANGKERFAEIKEMIPLEAKDLNFLKSVCGENLQRTMGITRISVSGNNQIIRADGVLAGYLNQIVKLNLHKRFAVVEVELFNRKQTVLFGVQLDQDLAG